MFLVLSSFTEFLYFVPDALAGIVIFILVQTRTSFIRKSNDFANNSKKRNSGKKQLAQSYRYLK